MWQNIVILFCVGVHRVNDTPEVVFCMGLVVACLEEEGGKRLTDTNDVVVGGLPRDRDKGLSSLRQLEGELFGRRGSALQAAGVRAALMTSAVVAKYGGVGVGVGGVSNVRSVRKNRRRVAASAWATCVSGVGNVRRS